MGKSSNTSTKIKKDYSALLGLMDGPERTQTLYSAQCVSYKMLLREYGVNKHFPVEWGNVEPFTANRYFDDLKTIYDGITLHYLHQAYANDLEIYKASRGVIGSRGKDVKRAKKRSSRILRALKKHYKDKQYHTTNKALSKAVASFHYAFREAFINIRIRMNAKLYSAIPDDFTIQLSNNKSMRICDLYKWDEQRNCYVLSKNMLLSKTDMRAIQIAISPIIFPLINFPKGL